MKELLEKVVNNLLKEKFQGFSLNQIEIRNRFIDKDLVSKIYVIKLFVEDPNISDYKKFELKNLIVNVFETMLKPTFGRKDIRLVLEVIFEYT